MSKDDIKTAVTKTINAVKNKWTVFEHRNRGTAWAFWRRFIEKFGAEKVSLQASSLAFFFVFALFPFFIFVTAIVTRFAGNLATSRLWGDLQSIIPPAVFEFLSKMLSDMGGAPAIPFASLGFLGLLWSASKGINLLFAALYRIYDRETGAKGKFFQRLLALAFILIFTISVLLVLFLLTYGNLVIDLVDRFLAAFIELPGSLNWASYLIGFAYLALLFAVLYYVASGKQKPFRHAMVAALVTSGLWALSTRLFGYLLASQTRYSVVFGGLTGILGLMLWLYLCATLLLVGAVLHDTLLWWSREKAQGGGIPAKRPHPSKTGEKRQSLRP